MSLNDMGQWVTFNSYVGPLDCDSVQQEFNNKAYSR